MDMNKITVGGIKRSIAAAKAQPLPMVGAGTRRAYCRHENAPAIVPPIP